MILVIGGQMCFGLFLDSSSSSTSELLIKVLGVIFIVIGVSLKEAIKYKHTSLAP